MSSTLSIARILITWLVMAVAMTTNGIARELLIKRSLGAAAADAASAILGMALIAAITSYGFRRLAPQSDASQLVATSALLVALTVAFETGVGRYVDHKPWRVLLEHYAIWRGELWPIVLAWLAAMPFLWGRTASAP